MICLELLAAHEANCHLVNWMRAVNCAWQHSSFDGHYTLYFHSFLIFAERETILNLRDIKATF